MRGTLSSYTFLFIHQVRTRRGLAASTTWVLLLFLLCSLVGRFGVSFLGFSFNLEESPFYGPPLFRPNWANGTVNPGPYHKISAPLISDALIQPTGQLISFCSYVPRQ